MTRINHHLSDPILMAYSAGTLPEAFNLMVASHVSLCDECRARVESFDAVGGAILEDSALEVAAMSDDALAATMALIAGGAVEPAPKASVRKDSILPAPLQDYIGGDLADVKWRSVGMGVKQAILPTSKDASARLLYIPAGAAMPDHGHRGIEMTMVLQGAFIDEGERFARGDVEIADSDLDHTPVADIGEDCICLAVTDGPLQFKSLLPKIAQPFLRI
ncbi:ChrR family anti-sigma-E factor [Aestuariivita boseongensis]|uniref:ChrR family anti-sigma-E factor n=1 Tax=Aestuariivita boseongensis TaxID=1470562 RepID=UPI0006826B77|nr:ChrR family anti-sigma-E factor [Aestuariivita boseongensis]